MSRVITGTYTDRNEAEAARADLAQRIALIDSAVVAAGDEAALERLGVPGEARAACAAQLERGAILLVARVEDEATADAAIAALSARASRLGGDAPAPAPAPAAETDEVRGAGKELRIGAPALLRGGARVDARLDPSSRDTAAPAEEEAVVGRRAAGRRLSDADVAKAGLLVERVFAISEMREEAVVAKQAFVREELVVRKQVNERVERIDETLRHTEVEIEERRPDTTGAPDQPAFGFDRDSDR
jgi:hypothetical protein